MTVTHATLTYSTTQYQQYLLITADVERSVADSGIRNGVAFVITRHTTTGIGVNEALECLESDIDDMLERAVPEGHPYAHARMLHSYGSTAGNPVGHLRAHLTGNHCVFPVSDGEIIRGDAQDIYLFEFDGPSMRNVTVTVMGE